MAVNSKQGCALVQSRGLYWRRAAVASLFAASADWLFFGHVLGVSIAVFATIVVGGALIANPVTVSARSVALAMGVLVACLLPSVEECSVFSIGFAIAGVSFFARATMADISASFTGKLLDSAYLLVSSVLRLIAFMERIDEVKVPTTPQTSPRFMNSIKVWALPFALGAIFVWLFVQANPIFEDLIPAFDLRAFLASLSPLRILLWIFVVGATWSFVVIRTPALTAQLNPVDPIGPALNQSNSILLGEAAILRSLCVFNIIFAFQTASDLSYLWGGMALPRGMTLATYAHRGAFPLIVTTLLAGAFVLATMRSGGAAERSGLLRALVFVWIGQNILLVLSSIMRLELYVATYSLTLWRVAAFIWMGLVAGGLVLVVFRILMRWSNAWLIGATLAMLLVTLYGCCFVNFSRLIATYNVTHARQLNTGCRDLDAAYLGGLGAEIIPVIDAIEKTQPGGHLCTIHFLHQRRSTLANEHNSRMADWRAWTFRRWRLSRYLATHAEP
jgi:hypothetical protein